MIRAAFLILTALASVAAHAPSPRAAPDAALPHVALVTPLGTIVVALEARRAPITTRNFLTYVAQHRFDGTSFYRAAKSKQWPDRGLVQGGINHRMMLALPPIAHEPTSQTGLRHVDGTLSMARNAVGTAMGDFFITIGVAPDLDAAPNYPGYAAFGHVVSGMDVVHRILDQPTWPGGWSRETIGQSLRKPVPIVRAVRVP